MTICEKKSGGRILCIRLSGLGDVAHALNALSLLRRHRPKAYIAWAVEDRFSDLLAGHPYIDELIRVPRLSWGQDLKSPLTWRRILTGMAKLTKRIRERRFEVTIDFQSSIKSVWLVEAAGAKTRIGFGWRVARELNPLVQNRLVSVPLEGCHRIERNLALLAPLGIPTAYADPVLVCSEADGRDVDEFVRGRSRSGPCVVIHPGTSEFAKFKRWLPERYARVADRLVRERAADVLISYGPGDRDFARAVLEAMTEKAEMIPPLKNLPQLVRLLSYADLFIGADTGPMHLASALAVPVVALFGPKDPVQTGPYGSLSLVVTGRAACRPCSRRRCSDLRCMTSIGVEEVFEAACSVLDGGGEKRGKEGLIRKDFTHGFRLGEWRGRIVSAYSSPDFYRWLCFPEAIVESAAARPIRNGPAGQMVTVEPAVAGERGDLTVTRYARPAGLARRLGGMLRRSRVAKALRAGLRLERAGIATPLPVCCLRKWPPQAADEFLFQEAVADAIPLRQWLTADGMKNWIALRRSERDKVVAAVAAFVRELHARNFIHGRLTDESILLCWSGDAGSVRFYLTDLEGVKRVGWLPRVLVEVLRALELRLFVRSLKVLIAEREKRLFLETYYEGFVGSISRRRLVEWILRGSGLPG